MTKCKYYIERNGGVCYGMKCAPNVSCDGDKSKCEVENKMQVDVDYELVNEIIFQIKIIGKDGTIEKVYCKTVEDAMSYTREFWNNRNKSRVYSLQITPIKNLYYKKK